MQTFHFEKTPVVPAHCLWVSGLLLISGCQVDAGRPRLQGVSHPAGNHRAMGDKAPGARGAPGANSTQKVSAALASLWAGGDGVGAETAETGGGGRLALHSAESLLWGAVALYAVPEPSRKGAEEGEGKERKAPGAPDALPEFSGGIRATPGAVAAQDEPGRKRVQFTLKPDPWNGTDSRNGTTVIGPRPPSFCQRIVTFTPTPTPRC